MFIFTWFLIPETKGISLEKMDELFGAVPEGKMFDEEGGRTYSTSAEKGGNVEIQQVEKR